MEGSQEDGNSLVRVRAQVMTRDDSTGGWVPMGAGGLSHVSVCKGPPSPEKDGKLEYLIFGKRIADQTVVLSCTIKRDFQYNKVMPTFHHWRTGDKKFGLTFQTAADARTFDRGVRLAIEDLSEGNGDFPNFNDSDLGDDDVFMTLELPLDSRSSSASSTFSSGPRPLPGGEPPHLHRMNFVRPPHRGCPPNNNSISGYVMDPTVNVHRKEQHHHNTDELGSAYVQLAKKGHRTGQPGDHDYSYPVVEGCKGGSPLKKGGLDPFSLHPAPRLPTKCSGRRSNQRLTMARAQCRHCLDMFSEADNPPGSCEYAPDPALACIGAMSCISCAQCMLYHCMADAEGDFSGGAHHPCTCDRPAAGRPGGYAACGKRWTALALLSLLVPCLWCYLPLRACHRCGVRCGICGGRHDPA